MLILAPENKNEHYYAPRVERSVWNGDTRTITISYTRQTCSHRDTTYTLERMVLPQKFHPQPVLTLEGSIREVATRQIIPAQINVYHAISFKPLALLQNTSSGTYKVALPCGQPYFVDITGENYSHYYGEFDCSSLRADTTIKTYIELDKQQH